MPRRCASTTCCPPRVPISSAVSDAGPRRRRSTAGRSASPTRRGSRRSTSAGSRPVTTVSPTVSAEALEDEDALARGLRVEEAVGLLGLVETPAMREQRAERNFAVGDEARAFFLAGVRERPRGVQGDLTPQQVLADLERDVVALAHERDPAPRDGAAHGLGARLRPYRAGHRALGALDVGAIV